MLLLLMMMITVTTVMKLTTIIIQTIKMVDHNVSKAILPFLLLIRGNHSNIESIIVDLCRFTYV